MRQSLGESRSAFHARHALISPDSHERVRLPLWPGCELIHLITPDLGAGFSLFLADATEGARIDAAPAGIERFALLRSGSASVILSDGKAQRLGIEGYAYLPAECDHDIEIAPASTIIVLERRYHAAEGVQSPEPLISSIGAHEAVPMKGDERLMLQKLIPEGPGFDMEINVMDFQPGASLPYVETHFMEHGLILLNGGGVYRLENAWYPIEADDAIWMGPFCPQWFGAIGRGNARYLIYKNWNRDPLDR